MKLRYLLIALVVIVVGAGIGLAVLSGNVDSFRPKIQAELQQKLNRTVSIGHLGLRIFPLSIKVEGFSIGEDPTFASPQPFALASNVFVSAELFSLLSGNPQVKEIQLEQPQIELIRNATGKWNFSTLGGSSSSSSGNSKFTLDELQIKDGRVALTDIEHHQPRSVYDHIDLKVTDFAPEKKFGVDLGVHLPGEGKQLAEFKGNVGPLAAGSNTSLPPVAGHLSLDEVSLAAVNRFAAGALPPQTDSVASGAADVDTSGGKIAAKGDLKLDNTVIHGAKLGYPIQAKYAVEADQAFNSISIQTGDVALGPTKFDASGTINNTVKPAVLDVRLKTSDASITELAKLAGAMGVAFSPQYKIDGRLTVDVTAKGPTTAPQLNGSITAKNVSASGGEIKEPVSTPEIDLTLSPQSVVSNTFVAKSGATSLDLSFSLANYATKDPVADVTLRSSGAQIAELLNIAKAYGVNASQGMSGTGTLSIDVHAHGETSHPNQLTYAGTASIQNAIINTPELTKPVGVRSVNAQFSQNSVALTNLAATVGATTLTGSVSAKNFTAPAVQFALSADKIDTEEMENLVAPSKPAGPAAPAKPGNEPSMLQTMTGGGTLAVNTIKAQEIVLTAVSTKVTLDHGLVTLSPMSAGAFNGKINGTLAADMRPKVPQCSLNAKLTGMDANALMSAVSSMKNQLYGSLGANTNLKFALASSNDLARTLNGTVDFALANGELKNVNILGDISKAAKLLNGGTAPASNGNSTALKQFSGTLNIVNGVANTNNLKAVMDQGSLAANGSLNLVSQGIDMHTTAVVSGLTLPVVVGGTTSHMTFTPDMQALAKEKLNGILKGGTSGQGVGGVLNGILGGQQKTPADAKQKQQPKNTVNSILDQFKKKQ